MTAAGPRLIGCRVHALDEVDSTQTYLARLAADGAPEGTVVIARHQTAGRGRRGRSWWDAPGQSLLLSVLLRPGRPAADAPQLSLVAGLAVSEALERAAGVGAQLRWPNDVLVGGRKIAGILPEAASRADGTLLHVILGIGINVRQAAFPQSVGQPATSLRLATGRDHDPALLREMLLERLDDRYREWLAGGFGPLRPLWRSRWAIADRAFTMPDGRAGVAEDVDQDGALLARAPDGRLVRVLSWDPEEESHATRH